jgi:hypothetical protein
MTRSEHYRCLISRTEGGRIVGFEVEAEDLEGGERHVRVNGNRAALVAGPFQEVLRKTGLFGRRWTSPGPLELPAALGAHVELLLRAVKPLRRTDRITTIAEGISQMSQEEAAYWHAQVQRRHGLQALRILLAGRSR